MTIIGNIFLVIATLLVVAIGSLLYGKTPQGEGALGYTWGLIILNLAFTACMILTALIIGSKGGFEWVPSTSSGRVGLVTIGLLTAMITAALSGLFKYEPGPVPMLLKFYSTFAPILIPIVMVAAGVVLLNNSLHLSVPIAAYKWPLIVISIIGVTGVAAGIIGYLSQSRRNQIAEVDDMLQRQDANQLRILGEIESNDVMKNLVAILVFTSDGQPPEVRDKAVAKIKTHPDWQQEIIAVLQTRNAERAFQFLSSNDVDDPSLFTEPVQIGIVNQAGVMRERIRKSSHPSHLYTDMFGSDVEHALRTADKFKGKGVDYLPAVRELRAALDEPSDFEKPIFDCTAMLDQWIKDNS